MAISKLPGPAAKYQHRHIVIKNINEEFRNKITRGQRLADGVARVVGSWPFIIYQSLMILGWIAVNLYIAYRVATDPGFWQAWDPYPFILLNLVLSFQSAYTGPIVMMSQNRQAEKDRLMAEHDFEINKKAEEEIKVIMDHLVYQDQIIQALAERLAIINPDPQAAPAAKKTDP